MKLLRKRDLPEDRYTNAFLGFGPEDSHFVVELTYSKSNSPDYNLYEFSPICNHLPSCIITSCLNFLFCVFSMLDYGVDKYDIGTGFGHFGIAVEDVSSYRKPISFSLYLLQINYNSFDTALQYL